MVRQFVDTRRSHLGLVLSTRPTATGPTTTSSSWASRSLGSLGRTALCRRPGGHVAQRRPSAPVPRPQHAARRAVAASSRRPTGSACATWSSARCRSPGRSACSAWSSARPSTPGSCGPPATSYGRRHGVWPCGADRGRRQPPADRQHLPDRGRSPRGPVPGPRRGGVRPLNRDQLRRRLRPERADLVDVAFGCTPGHPRRGRLPDDLRRRGGADRRHPGRAGRGRSWATSSAGSASRCSCRWPWPSSSSSCSAARSPCATGHWPGSCPSLDAVSGWPTASINGWIRLLTTLPPAGRAGDLLAVPYLCGFAGGALTVALGQPLPPPGLVRPAAHRRAGRQRADGHQGAGLAAAPGCAVRRPHHRLGEHPPPPQPVGAARGGVPVAARRRRRPARRVRRQRRLRRAPPPRRRPTSATCCATTWSRRSIR